MFIERNIKKELLNLTKQYPVITITGPRQSGKTVLAKTTFPKKPYINLENPDTREFALSDPRAFLNKFPDGVILDEIQRVPELMSYIQCIVDENKKKGMFILTGSQHFALMQSITQSLAGRTAILKLLPFSFDELKKIKAVKKFKSDNYLFNGFFPRIYDEKLEPLKAYRNYFETYIERDLRGLMQVKDIRLFRKFVKLCAGRIGSLFSANQLSSEVGVSVPTIKSWLSLLETSYIVFLLEPYHINMKKRLVKSPKLYFYDVGLATYLLGIEKTEQISRDPLRGLLFENMIIVDLIKQRFNKGLDHNLYFYRDFQKNEVDIIYKKANKIVPIEIKSAETFNSSFLQQIKYLIKNLENDIEDAYLVYAGKESYLINSINVINYKDLQI